MHVTDCKIQRGNSSKSNRDKLNGKRSAGQSQSDPLRAPVRKANLNQGFIGCRNVSGFAPLFEAVAMSLKLNDVRLAQDAVELGRRNRRIDVEGLIPLRELQVVGEDHRSALASFRQESEEVASLVARLLQVADSSMINYRGPIALWRCTKSSHSGRRAASICGIRSLAVMNCGLMPGCVAK